MSESKSTGKREKVRLLTAKQVREILEIDAMQLSRLVKSGKLHRIIPPLKRRGKYSSKEVYTLRREQEEFNRSYRV